MHGRDLMNLNKINLNLLRVLDVLCQVQSVSVAAERLGLTQSAVSHALNQLRELFQDELFVRGPSGMIPTPLTTAIGQRLHQIFRDLQDAVSLELFDPIKTTRLFTIACSEYGSTILLPKVLRRFVAAAPNARLRIVAPAADIVESLDSGEIDIAIAVVRQLPNRIGSDILVPDCMVWAMRFEHPLSHETITPASLSLYGHVCVARGLRNSAEDPQGEYVTRHGLSQWTGSDFRESTNDQSVANVTVGSYYVAMALVAESDMIMELPRRLAVAYADKFGLMYRADLPCSDTAVLSALWHRSYGDQPPVAWLRNLLREVAGEF